MKNIQQLHMRWYCQMNQSIGMVKSIGFTSSPVTLYLTCQELASLVSINLKTLCHE